MTWKFVWNQNLQGNHCSPGAAAAVDHADTELIGHRGWKGTGFLCDEEIGGEEYRGFLHRFFQWYKKTAQKHGYKSVPDSIAGLSESGGSAEHTGKSCSHPALVVRECGLMLQGMVSVFFLCCHTFFLRICRIRSHVPGPRGHGGVKSGACIQGFMAFLPAKAGFRPEYSRYTWQTGVESFHGVSWFPSPYIYIA